MNKLSGQQTSSGGSFKPAPRKPADYSGFITFIALAITAWILVIAKIVLLPLALAAMLTFLLAPLVIRLQRTGLPKPVAILATVIIAFTLLTGVGWLVTVQVVGLAEQLPRYEQTLRGKIRQINDSQELPGAFSRAGEVVENLQRELEQDEVESPVATPGARRGGQEPEPDPVRVEIAPGEQNVIESFAQVAGPFVGPLGTAGLVVIFVIAMLFQREDLRERFVQLIGGGRLNMATEAIDDAAKRISRYLRMQLLVNATYGIPIGIGLYLIGVPNALLWGLLAVLLRFIPYLGPWIAAAFPLALAFAVDPGWETLLLTLGLFLTVELISNNVIEPWLYGVSTGISNLALMVAAVFWAWLWGPAGLFLSTPLTVCLVVMAKYVPSLNFISVLLGSAPALEPSARLYQRMLAMDYDEMLRLSRDYLKDHTYIEFYDQMLIPVLNSAEADRHGGNLAEIRQIFILQHAMELIEDLDEYREEYGEEDGQVSLALSRAPQVLIVPAKDDIDEIAAHMLSRALAHEGIGSRLETAAILNKECAELVAREHIEVVCISAVPPAALGSARQLCRRLSATCADVKSVVAVWTSSAATDLESRLTSASPAAVVTTVQDAVEQIRGFLAAAEPESASGPAMPGLDDGQVKLPDYEPEARLDTVPR